MGNHGKPLSRCEARKFKKAESLRGTKQSRAMKEKLNQRTEPLTFPPERSGPITQIKPCANVQPQNHKQLVINTLTPKTMGTHGKPKKNPVAARHGNLKSPVTARHEAASRNE